MKYTFTSIFNKEKVYTINTEEPLELYNDFSLSITKINPDNKSYSYDNIDCVLKCLKHNELCTKIVELDGTNFSGFHMMVETFKRRGCNRMGEGIEMVQNNPNFEYKDTTLDNADSELRYAFDQYVKDNNIMNVLFQCFLHGVSYGKKKTHI